MKNMTTYAILKASIKKASRTYNDKALKEVLNNNGLYDDLNDLLFKYYERVHRMDYNGNFHITTFEKEEKEELKEFIKDNNMKMYKNEYDYNGFDYAPIKQKNTFCIFEIYNGYVNHSHYGFNVYEFMRVNDINQIIEHNGMSERALIW